MFHQEAVSNTALVFGWVIFAKFNKAEEIWRRDRKKKTNERRKESSLFLERPKLFASFNGRHVGAVPMPAFALPHSTCLPYRLLLLLLHMSWTSFVSIESHFWSRGRKFYRKIILNFNYVLIWDGAMQGRSRHTYIHPYRETFHLSEGRVFPRKPIRL